MNQNQGAREEASGRGRIGEKGERARGSAALSSDDKCRTRLNPTTTFHYHNPVLPDKQLAPTSYILQNSLSNKVDKKGKGGKPMRQTAINKAADTSNPNAMCTGTMKPAGTSNGLPNGPKEVEGGKGEVNERVSGSVAPSSNGEHTIPNSIPPPPNLDKHPPPLSMLLEGDNCGE
ncbi:hypothetical protein PAXRUDRAFT_17345 [Paxillus rubicundulus Ve08.2h10]|uniref:Uncharacterized protein n=1 Tax=Paxillus rubicundulus Ve08.2h10 TaxID=930991 RepID=A0A0D0DAT3_9AGAM|nr:hypothetical protein PAXRUDRAFT_17345 [Paxillus rubicundulus Ve08.2h10]